MNGNERDAEIKSWRTLLILLNVLAAAAVAWLAWWVLGHFARTLTLVAVAGLIAFILEPAVSFLERGMRSRTLAALLLYAAFVAALTLGIVYLAGPIKEQAQDLFFAVPRYREQVEQAVPLLENYLQGLEDYLARYGVTVQPRELAGQILQRVAGNTNRILSGIAAVVTGVGSALANLLLVLVISIYLVVDGHWLHDRMMEFVPARYRPRLRQVESIALTVFGNYLRGQLLLGLIIGVTVGVGMTLMGMPYPALLGVIAGVTELIPIVGAVLGAVPAVLVALFQPFPAVLYVTGFFILVQQLEGNVLVPRITGRAVGLHPLSTLIALLAGYEVAGLIGAVLAVPVAAVAYALLRELRPPGDGGPEGSGRPLRGRPPAPEPRAGRSAGPAAGGAQDRPTGTPSPGDRNDPGAGAAGEPGNGSAGSGATTGDRARMAGPGADAAGQGKPVNATGGQRPARAAAPLYTIRPRPTEGNVPAGPERRVTRTYAPGRPGTGGT